MRRLRVTLATFALLASLMVDLSAAQDRPSAAFELAAGWVGFADDGIVSESLVGGDARWYLRPRISVGPEIIYIGGNNHSHLTATANVTWDVFASTSGRPRRVTPFLVAGGGVFQTRETFFRGTFTSREGAFTAGGGVRTVAGDRLSLGVDARVGWELHVRVNGFAGLRLGR
jgi:hypothetical protein